MIKKFIPKEVKVDNKWFFFTLLYIVVDYARPQDILPIASIRPAMITILILSFYIINRSSYYIYDTKQIKLIISFVILLFLYIPFAKNNNFAWLTAKQMLLYIPFILSVVACVTTIDRLKRIVYVMICVMIYVASYSLLHQGQGSGNYFTDENDLSLYINMHIPICYFMVFYEKQVKMKIFYLFAMVIGFSAIVVSFSRGGFVGLLAVGCVIWIVSPKKVASLIVIGILSMAIYYFSSDVYFNEMKTISDTDSGTAKDRFESWKAGWEMFLDHPLGVGGNNFQIHFPEYQSDHFHKNMWGRAAHSLWFTLIPELGLVGIWIFFSLLYKNLQDILTLSKLRARSEEDLKFLSVLAMALAASFAGYFASGSFLSVLYYPHFWYMTAILVATINIASRITGLEVHDLIKN